MLDNLPKFAVHMFSCPFQSFFSKMHVDLVCYRKFKKTLCLQNARELEQERKYDHFSLWLVLAK